MEYYRALILRCLGITWNTLRSFKTCFKYSGEQVLSSLPAMFQPISSFFYADGVGMYTLTGVLCSKRESAKVLRRCLTTGNLLTLIGKNPV